MTYTGYPQPRARSPRLGGLLVYFSLIPKSALKVRSLADVIYLKVGDGGRSGDRKFADLYGAFPVKRLLSGFAHGSLFGAGKAVLHPVACDPVPGARGRGQGTETLAELGGLPP